MRPAIIDKLEDEKGKFKLVSKTAFTNINEDTLLEESDLCFQDDTHIYQFKYIEPKQEYKEKINPGIFSLHESMGKIVIKPSEFKVRKLLTSVSNTQKIVEESDAFFGNLDVYEELEQPKARKILMYSDPGMGKTAATAEYCRDALVKDPGTVVFRWPTAEIDSSSVSKFLSEFSIYEKECTRLILVMEDIGGDERENNGGARGVDSAMLELLDGLQVTFKLPTLILATTNYPQNLLSALADRPGRFDLILKLDPPTLLEQIALVEFISKKPIENETKDALKKYAKDFSIAHLIEVIMRSRLHKKSMASKILEIHEHKKLFNNNFEKSSSVGFGAD